MYQTEMNKTVEDNLTISFWMKGNVAVYIYMIDLYETKQEILKFDKSRSGNYHISLAKFSKPHPWNSLSDDDWIFVTFQIINKDSNYYNMEALLQVYAPTLSEYFIAGDEF